MILESILQGILEFLPVSSSAHLSLLSRFLNVVDPTLPVKVLLHFGTLISIVWVYRIEVGKLINGIVLYPFTRAPNLKHWYEMALIYIISTLPVIGAGFIISELNWTPSSTLIGINVILFGGILLLSDQRPENNTTVSMKSGLIIGLAQALAPIPGISRLGICLTACRFLKLKRLSSFDFSMILSIPAVIGACVLMGIKTMKSGEIVHLESSLKWLVCLVLTSILGIITLHSMRYFCVHFTFHLFFLYRLALGLCILWMC